MCVCVFFFFGGGGGGGRGLYIGWFRVDRDIGLSLRFSWILL